MHKILVRFQHGFRALHSSETQLINTVEDLASDQLDLLVLDFSEAFDTVAHQRLIGILEYYGIRGNTLEWITHGLTKRVQRVVVNGESSEEVPVKSGVPQGTVLGPLMFILYINDISENASSTVKLSVDDCLIYRRIQCQQDATLLQGDLDQLYNWARQWQMSFNPVSTSILGSGNLERPGLVGARQEHRDKGPSLLKPPPLGGRVTQRRKPLRPWLGRSLSTQGRSGTHNRQTTLASWSLCNARLRGLSTLTTADTPVSPGWWIILAGELYKRGALSAGWAYSTCGPPTNCLHHSTVHCNDPSKNQDQTQPPIHPSPSTQQYLQVHFLPPMCSNMEHPTINHCQSGPCGHIQGDSQ